MTTNEYENLPAVERERFMECPDCREILSLEEVLLHLAYKQLRDISYSNPESDRKFSRRENVQRESHTKRCVLRLLDDLKIPQ